MILKILHINLQRHWGGGEKTLLDLMAQLKPHNVKQYLMCRGGSKLAEYVQLHGIEHVALRCVHKLNIVKAVQIALFCRQQGISLIHAHDSTGLSLALMATRFNNTINCVSTRKLSFMLRPNFFRLRKYNHPRLKKILCISHAAKNSLKNVVHDIKRCEVVYELSDFPKGELPKLNPSVRQRYNISNNTLLIGMVAQLRAEKDHATLIKSMAQLKQKGVDFKCLIIGEGAEQANIEHLIKTHQCQEHIIMSGFMQNIPSVIQELDILMLTSTMDAFPSTLLDAFNANTAVVASRVGGIPELLIDGEHGLLAEAGNPKDFCAKLEYLIEHPKQKAAMEHNAKHRAGQFSPAIVAQAILNAYLSINDADKSLAAYKQ